MSYEEDYFTDFITNRSISFIKRTRATRPESPFLAVISHAAPHGPETPAPQYSTAFPDAQAPRYGLRLKRDGSLRLRLYGESLSREVGRVTYPSYFGLTYDHAFLSFFRGKGKKEERFLFPLSPKQKGKKDRLIVGYPGRANIS